MDIFVTKFITKDVITRGKIEIPVIVYTLMNNVLCY